MTAPTMDERRAVALKMRMYKCPVLPSHQTTREAVDAVVECMGLDGEEVCTVRQFLDKLADLIDPGEGMDEDCCEALDWVREHGGLDAVEARLIPEGMEWPRFKDGEPVRFLDDFERYGDENGIGTVTMYSDGSFALNFRAYSKGERVKRPAPKVLDADGVEIREGDTVYHVKDGSEMTVYGIEGEWLVVSVGGRVRHDIVTHRAPVLAADGRPLEVGQTVWHVATGSEYTVRGVTGGGAHLSKGNKPGGYCRADYLTHERPVLDADGKPLREGETVWHINGDGLQLTVVSVEGDRVVTTNARDGEQWWAAYTLTHEQPDSWERLEEDAGKEACEYFAHMPCGCETSEVLDETVEKCNAAKASDLVRRARALAGRGAE